MGILNIWLSLNKARKIAKDLDRFRGLIINEDHILEALWNHPLYEDDMWLDIDWNDSDRVIGIHVGVGNVIV